MKDLKDYFEKLDLILTILVIIDILLILGSVLFNLSNELFNSILIFDTVLCIILIINFIMKLRRSQNKRLFLSNNWLDLFASLPIALLILPFLSSTLYAYHVMVLVRFLRLILLLKVFSKFVEGFLAATYLDKVIAAFIVIILGSTLILYYFDPNITSIFDATWYVFQTITTVGYGDMIPTSPVGKFVGLLLLIAGVVMFSIITASFSHIFTEKVFKRDNEEFNKKMNTVKDNMVETKLSLDEIREKVNSTDEELAELRENINNLSKQMDNLIEIIEKKE